MFYRFLTDFFSEAGHWVGYIVQLLILPGIPQKKRNVEGAVRVRKPMVQERKIILRGKNICHNFPLVFTKMIE